MIVINQKPIQFLCRFLGIKFLMLSNTTHYNSLVSVFIFLQFKYFLFSQVTIEGLRHSTMGHWSLIALVVICCVSAVLSDIQNQLDNAIRMPEAEVFKLFCILQVFVSWYRKNRFNDFISILLSVYRRISNSDSRTVFRWPMCSSSPSGVIQ